MKVLCAAKMLVLQTVRASLDPFYCLLVIDYLSLSLSSTFCTETGFFGYKFFEILSMNLRHAPFTLGPSEKKRGYMAAFDTNSTLNKRKKSLHIQPQTQTHASV